MTESNRQIFSFGPYGERQLGETLSDLLIGLTLSPDQIWLVSAWVTDFDLLDNRSGSWDWIEPSWGHRYVTFSELLIAAVESGCELSFVTNSDVLNDKFFNRLKSGITSARSLTRVVDDDDRILHIKGLLCSSFFLAGSMNFTYSGVHRNAERIVLQLEPDKIAEAKLEFHGRYRGRLEND